MAAQSGKIWKSAALIFVFLFIPARVLPAEASAPGPTGQDADPLAASIDHLYNLEYDEAEQELEAWLSRHPDDLRALNYLATTRLHREMFRRQLEQSRIRDERGDNPRPDKAPVSPAVQQGIFELLDKVQSRAAARLRENSRDEEALYWTGVAHATRAMFHVILARSALTALRELKEARKYHTRLQRLNSNFVDALLVVGIYDYAAGSLPWYLKVLASITGYRGDKARGIAEVRRVAEEGRRAGDEAKAYLAIIYIREKKYPEALAIIQVLTQGYPRNYLLLQETARVYKAQGNWRAAAETYERILAKREAGEPGYGRVPLARIRYLAGEARSNINEPAAALKHFEAAGNLSDKDIFVYRAELAAANLYAKMDRRAEAREKYHRVASAVPRTEEGKAAQQALKQFPQTPSTPRPNPRTGAH